MEQEKQEALKECEVVVNTDPNNGPLDGASAKVNVARFIFNDDGQTFKHKVLEGNIKASYEIGTVSISVPEEKIMLAVRLDEIMQVMFAAAGAYRKLEEEKIKRRRQTMIEKVNPSHPDKVADRIAGAIVDLAYAQEENPKIAVEVLIGHGACHIITESSVVIDPEKIYAAVTRITGDAELQVDIAQAKQDAHLAGNQNGKIRCGDNGIFKGVPLTEEQKSLSNIAHGIYGMVPHDGKYILDGERLIICQSNVESDYIRKFYPNAIVNPLGDWEGGTDVDTGATNRKLGSDMADGVTGGGLHGKDLSKADVSVNIYAFLKAQETGKTVELCCAIGDDTMRREPYSEIVEVARDFINKKGGFEKFAEWGLF